MSGSVRRLAGAVGVHSKVADKPAKATKRPHNATVVEQAAGIDVEVKKQQPSLPAWCRARAYRYGRGDTDQGIIASIKADAPVRTAGALTHAFPAPLSCRLTTSLPLSAQLGLQP